MVILNTQFASLSKAGPKEDTRTDNGFDPCDEVKDVFPIARTVYLHALDHMDVG